MVIRHVELSKRAKKDLHRAPRHIAHALLAWIDAVAVEGLAAVRKIPGYHDEPLHGDRKGERSIRLSSKWRAIYVEVRSGEFEIARVEEVTPHKY